MKAKKVVKPVTAAVFNLPNCPGDVTCAAVDSCGALFAFRVSPENVISGRSCWKLTPGAMSLWHKNHDAAPAVHLGDGYDTRDWEHSKILKACPKPKKKLTRRVFNYFNCPADAACAVVDAQGTAWWCITDEIEPSCGTWKLELVGQNYFDSKCGRYRDASKAWSKIGEGFDATDWLNSKITPDKNRRKPLKDQSKKVLDQTVFDLPECPKWAKCAVVNSDGNAYWCATPDIELKAGGWMLTYTGYAAVKDRDAAEVWKKVGSGYDTHCWDKRIIYRPDTIVKEVAAPLIEPPDRKHLTLLFNLFGAERLRTAWTTMAVAYLTRKNVNPTKDDIDKAMKYLSLLKELL